MEKTASAKLPDGNGFKVKKALSVTRSVLLVLWKCFLNLAAVGCITGVIVGFTMMGYIMTLTKTSANLDLKTAKVVESSYIYETAADGTQVLATSLHGIENREWVDLDKIPVALQQAFISIEDKRFYEHKGVDWKRTAFAVVNMFVHASSTKQGGSTITQQLIKNRTGDNADSIQRKLREIFSALNAEKEYSKEEILEAYLNTINLGNGTYGVQTAAQSYFDKDVSELTLLECAALAGITQNPTYYNPYYYPESNKIRRNLVLSEMYKQGKISREEYDTLREAELTLAREVVKKTEEEIRAEEENPTTAVAEGAYDYYTDMVIEDVISDLMEKYGWNQVTAETKLYQGGLRIYSAVDMELQEICEQVFLKGSSLPSDKKLQAGIFATDYQGRILATVGRRGQKTDKRGWNNALHAIRQPGSAIKPLSVYAYAIEKNYIDWSSIIEDEPLTIDDELWPRNSYNSYRGEITAQKALEISSNACAARLVNSIGMESCYYFMKNKFHISTAVEKEIINSKDFSDINLSTLATGGMTNGVYASEMTAAYASFGNGGKYYKPYSYYYVTDKEGNVLLDNREVTYEQIISEDTAFIVNRLLKAIVEGSEGTAKYARMDGWELYGKTGTTSDNKDRWYMGGNPYCIAGIWVGYETPKKINTYNHPAVPIWREIMVKYLADKAKITFDKPSGVVTRNYCAETGGVANSGCPNVLTGWYKKGVNNTPACTEHEGDPLDPNYIPPEPREDEPTESGEGENSSSPESVVSKPESAVSHAIESESKPVSKPESQTTSSKTTSSKATSSQTTSSKTTSSGNRPWWR